MLTPEEISSAIKHATRAANNAGRQWLETATPKYEVRDWFTGKSQGQLLDLCGNAHVIIKDRRTAIYKSLNKLGYVDNYGSKSVIKIRHDYVARQEHGLQKACALAAKSALTAAGFTNLDIWDYID